MRGGARRAARLAAVARSRDAVPKAWQSGISLPRRPGMLAALTTARLATPPASAPSVPMQTTNRRVAIKKIKDVFRDLVDAKRILREVKLLRYLGGHQVSGSCPHGTPACAPRGRAGLPSARRKRRPSPTPPPRPGASRAQNIIWILDIMVYPNSTNFRDLYIVTDLMDTDLSHIIASQQTLSDAHIKYFLYQMLRGLKYVHSAGVLHR